MDNENVLNPAQTIAMAAARDRAAAEAASLVKATAEAAATALNIQYIQRDITDIKQSLKEMNGAYVRVEDFTETEKKQVDHETRLRGLETFMNTLIGKMAAISFGSSIVVSFIFIGVQYFLSKR